MDVATGSKELEDPRVDRPALYLVSHIISCHYAMNDTLCISHVLISLALSENPSGSSQLCGSSQPISITLSHCLPSPVKPAVLFLENSVSDAVSGAVKC